MLNERRIQSNFTYFQNILTKQSEMTEKVFSKLELYMDILPISNRFLKFRLAAPNDEDIDKIDLLKVGKELVTESANLERCFEGNEFSHFDMLKDCSYM